MEQKGYLESLGYHPDLILRDIPVENHQSFMEGNSPSYMDMIQRNKELEAMLQYYRAKFPNETGKEEEETV